MLKALPMAMSDIIRRNNQTLVHLSLLYGVGPLAVLKLLRHLYSEAFPDVLHVGWTDIYEHHTSLNLELLYNYSTADFIRAAGLTDKQATSVAEGLADVHLLSNELRLAADCGVTIVTVFDEEYPEILKQIYTPPLILYYQGKPLQSSAKCMGIVGSRKATGYAEQVIDNLVPGLVSQGWHIVSGGAEGADTMAHQKALDVGGYTTAVPGSGLLQPYPASNRALFRRMAEATGTGTVLSPFPLNTQPERGNFPARNRIIAGLSLGCVVVQAAEKSGALITAHCALEQGRQVFAVPGMINDELSVGCHALIKQGAKLVNSLNDILEEFSESLSSVPIIPALKTELDAETLSPVQEESHTEADSILLALQEPATLDEILMATGCDVATVQDRLFTLQLEGRVRQTFVGTWERTEGL